VELEILPAGDGDRPRLEALWGLYVYDWSEILGLDVEEDGRFDLPSLDEWFGDPGRRRFLFRVDGKWAGFALIDSRSHLSGEAGVLDMSEFFVLRKYRRCGLGERAAGQLFDRFRGRWEVRERRENRAAAQFWRRIIGRYTGGRFTDEELDDDRWRGPVQRFDNG
jgi:predicted acetyltransferase